MPFRSAEGRKCSSEPLQVPIASTQVEAMEAEDVQEEIADEDEEAELPDLPEVEDEEAAAEEQAGDQEAKEVVQEVAAAGDSSGMIGQLPTENEVAKSTSGKDYATTKKLAWDKVKSLLGHEVVLKRKKWVNDLEGH